MAMFGWIVMLFFALYVGFNGFIIFMACLGLKGRIDGEGVFGIVLMIACMVALYFLWNGAPFSISFN